MHSTSQCSTMRLSIASWSGNNWIYLFDAAAKQYTYFALFWDLPLCPLTDPPPAFLARLHMSLAALMMRARSTNTFQSFQGQAQSNGMQLTHLSGIFCGMLHETIWNRLELSLAKTARKKGSKHAQRIAVKTRHWKTQSRCDCEISIHMKHHKLERQTHRIKSQPSMKETPVDHEERIARDPNKASSNATSNKSDTPRKDCKWTISTVCATDVRTAECPAPADGQLHDVDLVFRPSTSLSPGWCRSHWGRSKWVQGMGYPQRLAGWPSSAWGSPKNYLRCPSSHGSSTWRMPGYLRKNIKRSLNLLNLDNTSYWNTIPAHWGTPSCHIHPYPTTLACHGVPFAGKFDLSSLPSRRSTIPSHGASAWRMTIPIPSWKG